ncbi:outer membrane beta-barrel protein [Rhodopila sp.]|uniref:outer membrane beta-barrel protein n=1 Tax=Rhodopila sp. TaxID=2480087 RepID=UPI003D103E41
MSLCIAESATAQMLPSLFPEGVPGYDTAPGVTVQSRLHPDFTPLGLRDGAFQIFPSIDESIGYNSNVLPGSAGRGSWQVTTAPALIFGSDWPRDQVGAAVTVQNTRYLSLPSQDRTDVSASAGGRIDIGEDQLTIAAAHASRHEDRGEIDTIISDRPIAFQVDDLRAAYTLTDGSWSLTPNLDVANWRLNNTTILGLPASQAYRDRIVGQGDLTLRYELAPLRNILFVARALGQDYTHIPSGQPSTNSHAFQVLTGFDFDANTVWRWRLLLGGETRQFTASVYRPQNTLIAEAEASWSPSGMTTIHAGVSRDTQDAAQEGIAGLTYSTARLTVDHEYLRNVMLTASVGLQQADYFQGGRQSGFTAGAGVTWLLNRSVRLSLTYDQTDLHGGSASAQTSATRTSESQSLATGYSRSLTLLTFHFAL